MPGYVPTSLSAAPPEIIWKTAAPRFVSLERRRQLEIVLSLDKSQGTWTRVIYARNITVDNMERFVPQETQSTCTCLSTQFSWYYVTFTSYTVQRKKKPPPPFLRDTPPSDRLHHLMLYLPLLAKN
jgi:hypothetical protein